MSLSSLNERIWQTKVECSLSVGKILGSCNEGRLGPSLGSSVGPGYK